MCAVLADVCAQYSISIESDFIVAHVHWKFSLLRAFNGKYSLWRKFRGNFSLPTLHEAAV